MYKIKNTELDFESRIFHLHKIFYSACYRFLSCGVSTIIFPSSRKVIMQEHPLCIRVYSFCRQSLCTGKYICCLARLHKDQLHRNHSHLCPPDGDSSLGQSTRQNCGSDILYIYISSCRKLLCVTYSCKQVDNRSSLLSY